jgi:hypothetical protein
MENQGFSQIDRPEIVSYIKSVGKELAHAVKKTKKKNLDTTLKDVLYCLNEPVGEKQKTLLDYHPKEYYFNNDKSRIKSIENRITENVEDFGNMFNPLKKSNMNKTFYDRKKEELIKKQKKLEIIKNKKRIEEEKYYKAKPQITKQSQKILETKLIDKKPIYERTSEILNGKNQKIEKLKSMYNELKAIEEEESIGSFKPPGQYDETRFNQWTKERELREKKKKEKIDKIKTEIEYLETESMKNMHKPSIDRNSQRIAKSKMSSEDLSESVYNKLYNLHGEKKNKINLLSQKSIPTFTPSINTKLPPFLQSSLLNKVTKNSSLSIGNRSTNKKPNSKHFMNSSMDFNTNLFLHNENLAGQYSRNKFNSSMTEIYNNPMYNISQNNEEDPDSYSRYRSALHSSKDKKVRLQKQAKFNPYNSYNDNGSWKDNIPWQKSIHFVNESFYGKDEFPNSLYKINIRNSSAWDKNRENQIMMDSRVSVRLRNVNFNRTSSAKK